MAEQVTSSHPRDEELSETIVSSDVPFDERVVNLVAIDNANMPIVAEQVTSSHPRDEELSETIVSSDVPFDERVVNLVAIDNASMPIEDASKPRGNQLLKKALDESIRETETCAIRIKELDERTDRVKTSILQVLGFYIVFQGVVLTITVAAAQKSFLLVDRWIPMKLSVTAGVCSLIAIVISVKAILKLKKERQEGERRRRIFKHNELQLQRYGHRFDFNTHGRNYKPRKNSSFWKALIWRGPFSRDFLAILFIYGCTIAIFYFEWKIMLPKGSTSAGGAPSPAPSIPVQSGTLASKTWCVAKAGSPDTDVMNGLNFACGQGGADCGAIQAGGVCFNPNTIVSHASFAYNTYYQKVGRNIWNCDFGGTGVITNTDPSYSGCSFP